jgi:uncharacterized Fe-S cluster-containing radical SAM superfamily protein
MIKLPFDPIERAREAENAVSRGTDRKYYRFRAAPYYGGIATADAVGCCFLCAYCWNYGKILKPQTIGKFYSPAEVANNLYRTAWKKQYRRCRITGCEPILGERSLAHLCEVITRIHENDLSLDFILETNGLMLGLNPEFIEKLKFPNLHIRVAVKGWDESSFQEITGADKDYFELPLRGLKKMLEAGLDAWLAVMWDVFGNSGIEKLNNKLNDLGIESEVEVEAMERYPHVMENIADRKLSLIDL